MGRQKRLLNVFTIVSFPNDACTITTGNTNTSGTETETMVTVRRKVLRPETINVC